MESAVVNWLNRNGYDDVHECMIGGYCDIVGCAWSERIGRRKPDLLEMICVELKLEKIEEVIAQAKGNHYHANLSYCAMPTGLCCRMRRETLEKFWDAGVGLLSVDNDLVQMKIRSRYQNKMPDEIFRNRLWANQLRNRNHKNRAKEKSNE